MELRDKIQEQAKEALKSKEQLKLSVLRMLLAAIFNKEKEKRAKLSKDEKDEKKLIEASKLNDQEVLETINSEARKRKDSIEQFEKAGRQELADKEKSEMEILAAYLPEQLSEEEIRKIVKETISQTGASGPKETGKVMAALMPQVKGKADGTIVSKIVQEELKGKES
jgi:uncharacterized protein YqeY